ncbi:hypothetical protein FQA39_LY18211 [Lamprigera yunnana]|nr:hypothetical protein FQA39_LY18211 [Lamprigera yunnana]
MHVVVLILLVAPFIKGELRLIISEYLGGHDFRPVNSTVEVTSGTNYELVCMVGGYGTFTNPQLRWGRRTKELKFRNENDLLNLAKNRSKYLYELQDRQEYFYYTLSYESNKHVRLFEPIQLTDQGVHFCMSLKYMLFKIVHIRVKEPPQFNSVKCGTNKFKCVANNFCIKSHYVCDGKADCGDASDENHVMCHGDPCYDKLQCEDGRCIPKSWCCDRHTDALCDVIIRHSCCPPLVNPYDFNPLYTQENISVIETHRSSGSKYLFITICVVSALLSFVLFLFIISKICGFHNKWRSPSRPDSCEHSECVLRRQFSADVTCLYRRDVINMMNNSDNNNELADSLILNEPICDQPPSYTEVINTLIAINKESLDELLNAPPPPYPSAKFPTETSNNQSCDRLGDNSN